MPDGTIPLSVIVTLGVIFCAAQAAHAGDYRASAVAGVIGTIFNGFCFYRRLSIQARAERQRSARRNDAGQPTKQV